MLDVFKAGKFLMKDNSYFSRGKHIPNYAIVVRCYMLLIRYLIYVIIYGKKCLKSWDHVASHQEVVTLRGC